MKKMLLAAMAMALLMASGSVSARQADPTRARRLRCPPNKVWSERLRRCVCRRILKCRPRYYFNRQLCNCQPTVTPSPGAQVRCPPGKVWNQRLRRCVCRQPMVRCRSGYVFNPRTCRCYPAPRPCPRGMIWNAARRMCVPITHREQ